MGHGLHGEWGDVLFLGYGLLLHRVIGVLERPR
jgi:hypothetical protein